jgi:hypothetical protein
VPNGAVPDTARKLRPGNSKAFKEINMKSLRILLPLLVVTVTTVALAQSDGQKSFDKMKTLSGTWIGRLTTEPKNPEMEKNPLRVVLRITSRGNAIVHEMADATTADDPTKYDHPVTMFYVDNDHLLLTHYCDAGNRPRMTGKLSPDGKQVEFAFLDLSGGTENGHMDHAVFTVVDGDHHIEDWTYMMPGDKPMHAHMDLQRAK